MGGNTAIINETANEVPTIKTMDDLEEFLKNYISPNDTVALLMDFDGTLAAITPHPDNTLMKPKTKELFHRLCNKSNIFPAVISGRGINDVKSRVGVDDIVYAGCHGLEILYTDGHKYDHFIPQELQNNITTMYNELIEKVGTDEIWIENKRTALCVHYHELPEEQHQAIFEKSSEIITKYGYLANKAHGAVDAKPPVQWNKGKAAVQILESNFGADWADKVKVVFAGDDATDEDAMTALKGNSVTFRVSQNPKILTNANYILPTPDHVYVMLQWIEKRFH